MPAIRAVAGRGEVPVRVMGPLSKATASQRQLEQLTALPAGLEWGGVVAEHHPQAVGADVEAIQAWIVTRQLVGSAVSPSIAKL